MAYEKGWFSLQGLRFIRRWFPQYDAWKDVVDCDSHQALRHFRRVEDFLFSQLPQAECTKGRRARLHNVRVHPKGRT